MKNNVTIGAIAKIYVDQCAVYSEERGKIEAEVKQRNDERDRLQREIYFLNEKLIKLISPSWIDAIIKPIAEELIKHFPGRRYELLGPFGLSSETAIHFYRIGVDEKHLYEGDNCKSITFRPVDLEKGELGIVDYKTDTGKFGKGTLGEMNGYNHPTIPLSPDTTIEELAERIG